MILRCPRCLSTKQGEFNEENPPGRCNCGTFQHWRVIKELPKPGFVRVISDKGWQELKGPNFQEDPDGWKR